MRTKGDLSLPELIADEFGTKIFDLSGRFCSEGWYYQGESDIACMYCDRAYEIFRKPYETTKREYEYWGIVCLNCKSCVGLDVMSAETREFFRDWDLANRIIKVVIPKVPITHQEDPIRKREVIQITSGTQKYDATGEQMSILEAALETVDLSIEALAGTGKTSTLKMLAESKKTLKGTYIAFNKSIVDEAKSTFPGNVHCATAHSLAFGAVGRDYKERLSNAQRMSFKQVAEWLEAPQFRFKSRISDHVLDPAQIAQFAQATVRNFCKSVDEDIAANHLEMPILISIDKNSTAKFGKLVVPLARKIWEDIQLTEGFMRFNHDHYLKMWQLSKPRIKADFILFDEAQDADPVMLDVINRQTSAQIVYCGDEYQAIYEWRGAKNALTMVDVDDHLWLTQSFRFGDPIAEKANEFLELLGAPMRVKGYKPQKSFVRSILNADAILCRTNAGVIAALMNEQAHGRKVSIIGRTQELIDFAEACDRLQHGKRSGHPELAPFSNWESVLGFIDEFPDESQEIKTMVELIQTFSANCLVAALKQVVHEEQSDVVISTAHRAKGREWGKVKLNGDFLHVGDMDTEDLRLAYVAVTRAEVELDMTAWDLIQPRVRY